MGSVKTLGSAFASLGLLENCVTLPSLGAWVEVMVGAILLLDKVSETKGKKYQATKSSPSNFIRNLAF